MDSQPSQSWSEENSRTFLDYGRYFVPYRDRQMQIIAEILAPFQDPHVVLELACGEGLLTEVLLEGSLRRSVVGLDGSAQMREQASKRNARFAGRFTARPFDLAATDWRQAHFGCLAVVSSLAVHHLDGPGKEELFRDIYRMLVPGGVLVIADLVKPAHPQGWQVAAKMWDEAVKTRAMELDGHEYGFVLFKRERWNMYYHFDPDDIDKLSTLTDQLAWMKDAGFQAVDVYWMEAGHAIFGGWKTQG